MDLGPTDDRETNIQWHHDEDVAHVYTCDERMITRLKKNPLAVVVQTHHDQQGRITGFEFDIPIWAVILATKKRVGTPLTPERREAAALRLKAGRRGQSDHPSESRGLS